MNHTVAMACYPEETFTRGAKFSYGIRFRSLLWLSFFSRFWPPRFKVLFFISSFFFYSSSSRFSACACSSFSPPPYTIQTHASLIPPNLVFCA